MLTLGKVLLLIGMFMLDVQNSNAARIVYPSLAIRLPAISRLPAVGREGSYIPLQFLSEGRQIAVNSGENLRVLDTAFGIDIMPEVGFDQDLLGVTCTEARVEGTDIDLTLCREVPRCNHLELYCRSAGSRSAANDPEFYLVQGRPPEAVLEIEEEIIFVVGSICKVAAVTRDNMLLLWIINLEQDLSLEAGAEMELDAPFASRTDSQFTS